MAKLTWDGAGEKKFFLGNKKGVLYIPTDGVYSKGYAWNGLSSVSESPSGADANDFYADDILYGTIRGTEKMEGSIECYTYPEEFNQCIGKVSVATGVTIGQQEKKAFGFSFVNSIGNDVDGIEAGYEIHLVYGATVSPMQRDHQTENDSPEAETMSIDYSCVPVDVDGHKPTAQIVIDSTTVKAETLKKLEDILYGNETTEARLPLPNEVISLMSA